MPRSTSWPYRVRDWDGWSGPRTCSLDRHRGDHHWCYHQHGRCRFDWPEEHEHGTPEPGFQHRENANAFPSSALRGQPPATRTGGQAEVKEVSQSVRDCIGTESMTGCKNEI